MKLDESIKLAKSFLGDSYFLDLMINYEKIDETNKLIINKDSNKVLIQYGSLSLLFLGLTILKEKYKCKRFSKKFINRFTFDGIMHDCSRNGTLNLNQIKEMILVSALLGRNKFLLYIEDCYEIEGEPYFGYLRGRYSKDEIKQMLDYARGFGIDIVPCIQTLSHLNQLKWLPYGPVKETDFTLLVKEEKTYELIEKMIKTCKENFETDVIHIGMDEAFDLGSGLFIRKNISIDKKEAFLYHLGRVNEICKKYSVTPIMWGDMFFKYDSVKTQDWWYNFEGFLSKKTKALIPENVSLVYWDYYTTEKEKYDKMNRIFKNTKRDYYFADGTLKYVGFAPNFEKTFIRAKAGLESAIQNKVHKVFTTSWGDEGNECTVISSYPLLTLHAIYSIYGKYDFKKFNALLKAVTGDDFDTWSLMMLPNKINEDVLPFENPSKSFLYQDLLLGLFDTRVKEEYVDLYKNYSLILKRASKKSPKYNYIYLTLANLCDAISKKIMLGKTIRKQYKDKDKNGLKESIKNIQKAIVAVKKFYYSYQKQWDKENKAFAFEIFDGRVGFLLQRMDTAKRKITAYLNNEISEIPELEVDILKFNNLPDEEAHCFNNFLDIMTVNKF